MSKTRNISGFPEWLPAQKLVEDRFINTIREIYSSHGFVPIETPAAELLSTLTSKGEINKEIYVLKRLHEDGGEDSELALHYDLTVPLARYVAQHYNELEFPFKRYQLQKVWRGERPQRGRFREFYQFDADIIARDTLPISCDAEVVTLLDKIFTAINIGPYQLRINNRKILQGLYRELGLNEEQTRICITAVDKLDKIGPQGVRQEIVSRASVSEAVAAKMLNKATVKIDAAGSHSELERLGVKDELFEAGVRELMELISFAPPASHSRLVIDLSLARGFDYYTGLIVEVHLTDFPAFGSAAGGGRYDDLASQFINKRLPGVGVSCGLTRLMELVFSEKLVPADNPSLTTVLVTVNSEAERAKCNDLADRIRANKIPTEVYYQSPKLGKQIEYAAKRGIPYVIFLDSAGTKVEVKNMSSKEQRAVGDIEDWCRATQKR